MSAYHKNALPAGFHLQEYLVESILGHGGFGITYLAQDTRLNSKVAIKEFLPHQIATRDPKTNKVLPSPSREAVRDYHWGLKNFVKEARALAQFKHPNIVRVLRFFEENGTAYMVMEYEKGQSLAQYLKDHGPRLEEAMLLRIFIPILNGLQAVHQANMLHLDIKPENIYLREDGSPTLIDFGSARQAMSNYTHGERIALTHGFAPMEQYPDKGQQGPWTDVYALGATMYRCVTGKRPDGGLERYQAVIKYQTDPLAPATKLGKKRYQPNLLECIDWAMQVHPSERPQSAREMQDGLMGKGRAERKSLPGAGMPAQFRSSAGSAPVRTAVYRPTPARTGGRRPGSGVVIVLLLAAAVAAAWYLWPQLQPLLESLPPLSPAGAPPAKRSSTPPTAPSAASTPATPASPDGRVPEVMPAGGGRAPSVHTHTLSGHADWISALAFSPDGRWMASGSNDKTVRLWDAQSGAAVATLQGHGYPVNSVAYAPDGKWVASAGNDGTVRLWDVRSGGQRAALRGYGNSLFTVAFSPDGNRLAAAGRDRAVFVWEVASGRRLSVFEGHKGDVNSIAISPDGKVLAAGGSDRVVRIWNMETGAEVVTLSGHKDPVLSVAFSADGRWLASGDAGGAVRLWNASDFTPVHTIADISQSVLSVAVSHDGRWVAAGAADHSVRVYDTQGGLIAQRLDGHRDYVGAVAFSVDGSLASGSRDRSIRLWKARP